MPVKKLLLLADIHSNTLALNAIFDKVQEEVGKIDYIFGLGDYVGYSCYPNEVIDIVKKRFDVVIMGNHDLAGALGNADGFNRDAKTAALWNSEQLTEENRTFLSILEQQHHFHIFPEWSLFVIHGTPVDPINGYLRPDIPDQKKDEYLQMIPQSRFMFNGHTHIPMIYKGKGTAGDTIIVNPGSVGQPRDRDPRASACVLYVSEDPNYLEVKWIRAEYNITDLAREMREQKLPHRLAERLFFGE
jgi:predicted phosphodiesterase